MEKQKPTDINATEMQSPVNEVLGITELLEHILLQVDSIRDITRAQRVCRRWRSLIKESQALQRVCWYRPHGEPDAADPREWRLNPVFASLGMSISEYHFSSPQAHVREEGGFDLTKRVYDKPGSWTTMLATQPPCRWMQVECSGSNPDADDFTYVSVHYLIESTAGCLLVGDVMAVLAECQNRQEKGLDYCPYAGFDSGDFSPLAETDDLVADYRPILQDMADDVSVKVAVTQAWATGSFPAFSLRRVRSPAAGDDEYAEHDPASYMGFIHELVVHRMVRDGEEFEWYYRDQGGFGPDGRVCKEGRYQANLLAVRNYEGEYLAACSHIFRLLSDL